MLNLKYLHISQKQSPLLYLYLNSDEELTNVASNTLYFSLSMHVVVNWATNNR